MSDRDAEPFGASFSDRDGVRHFSLLSRGDRVRGVLASPTGSGPHALALIATAEGLADAQRASSLQRVIDADGIAVAVIDLPLCGTRASDKLRLSDVRPGDVLWPDLQQQLDSDLRRTLAWLASAPELDADRVAFTAFGLAGALAENFISGLGPARARALPAEPPADWAEPLRTALRSG